MELLSKYVEFKNGKKDLIPKVQYLFTEAMEY